MNFTFGFLYKPLLIHYDTVLHSTKYNNFVWSILE